MSHRKTLARLALAALAAGAVAAPAAVAAPIHEAGGPAPVAQDLRSPDAATPAIAYSRAPAAVPQDLRSPDAADPPVVTSRAPLRAAPTPPASPAPITAGDGDGTGWLVPGLGLAAALLAGSLVAVRMRVRTARVAG